MSQMHNLRIQPQEIQTMNIVIAHGVSDLRKDLCCVGWAEDKPHDDDSAVILNEPLYFVYSGAQTRFIVPDWGVASKSEIFEYTKIDIYEGVAPIGALYIEHLVKARTHSPRFEGGFVTESELKKIATKQQGSNA